MSDGSIRKDIEAALAAVRQAETAQEIAEANSGRSKPAEVRWYATKLALGVWAVYIVGLGLFTVFGDVLGAGNVTAEKTSFLIEVLKIGILPIVTFAIGHYF